MHSTFQIGNKNYSIRELLLREYKEVLKTFYGEEPDFSNAVLNVSKLLSQLLNKDELFFLKQISVVELFLIMLQVRNYSLGNILNINLTHNNNKIAAKLDLNKIFNRLNSLVFQNENIILQINKKIKVQIGFPTADKLLALSFDDTVLYIKSIIVNERSNKSQTFTENSDIETIINNLPVKQTFPIVERINQLIKDVNRLNLLDFTKLKDQILVFSPTIESFIWFTKLIFNESLDVFYSNCFHLSYTGKMNLDYIENSCTPGEYFYFVQKLQATLKEQQNNLSKSSQQQMPLTHGKALSNPDNFFTE